MRLYPAIDIKDGKCVRLKKGLFNEVTVYSDKPYEIAESFEADGAKFIHTVDLDGARGGHSVNSETIKKIVDSVEHIVVGIDAKNGMVAVEGWEKVSDKTAISLALAMKDIGVKTIVYTDISKDGMLSGPNIEQTKLLSDKTGIDIIASGGMSCMDDLRNVNKAGIHGAIMGKSLYEKKIILKDAVKEFEN